jgi:hypothetical protein
MWILKLPTWFCRGLQNQQEVFPNGSHPVAIYRAVNGSLNSKLRKFSQNKVMHLKLASPNCSTGDGMIVLVYVIGRGHRTSSGYPRMSHHYKNEVQRLLFRIRTHLSFGRPRTPSQCNFCPLDWNFSVKQAVQLLRYPGTPVGQCGQQNTSNTLLKGLHSAMEGTCGFLWWGNGGSRGLRGLGLISLYGGKLGPISRFGESSHVWSAVVQPCGKYGFSRCGW